MPNVFKNEVFLQHLRSGATVSPAFWSLDLHVDGKFTATYADRSACDGDGGSISQSPPAPIPSRPGTDGNPFGQDFPKPTAGKNVRRAYARAYGAHNSAHNFAARRASGEGSGGVSVGGVLEAIWGDSWRVPICCKIVVKINI